MNKHTELINEYYDLMGEKFVKVLSKVDDNAYCVSIKDQSQNRVSTLIEICNMVDGEYAVERDWCKPGEEKKMIESYLNPEEGGGEENA